MGFWVVLSLIFLLFWECWLQISNSVLWFSENSSYEIITSSLGVGGFWWCGVTGFVQSWQVTSRNHLVLGRPDRYSMAMVIATTGSNWLLVYSRVMGTWNPTRPLCRSVWWHVMAHQLCLITWLEQASYEKKSHCSCGSTFSRNQPAFTGYVVQRITLITSGGLVPLLLYAQHWLKLYCIEIQEDWIRYHYALIFRNRLFVYSGKSSQTTYLLS